MRRLTSIRMVLAGSGLLAILLLLGAVACGGDSGSGGGNSGDKAAASPSAAAADKENGSSSEGELFVDPKAPVVNVALKEWSIVPNQKTIPAGEVTFAISNDGTAKHEFVVIKTDTPADKLPNNQIKVDEDNAGTSPGEVEGIEAHKTVSKTFTLAPGHYVFICNMEGHYMSGMHTDFTVS